jgi:uncharacterized membrane protein
MAHYIKLYFIMLASFLVIDMVWLGFVARTFYNEYLGYLFAPAINWPAALLFYLLFVAGLLFLVVVPGLEKGSLRATLLRAALFGLVTYATYDLTNLATIKGWPLLVTVVDLAWGIILSVAVSTVGFIAAKSLGPHRS